MPYPISPEQWQPLDNLHLTEDTLEVVKSDCNYSVVAGPGTGKTELLAQRAGYLLQTGICPLPRQILALSYKRDAAANLQERIRTRLGQELDSRFTSITYDSFAKSLLDRFRHALPENIRPTSDYEIASSISDAVKRIYPVEKLSKRNGKFLEWHFVHAIALPDPVNNETDKTQQTLHQIWYHLLWGGKPEEVLIPRSILTFPMIATLADQVVLNNPILRRGLLLTFSHVFLDEFQDTTKAHYRLLKTCFYDQSTVITTVSDEKQRIMTWAGAQRDVLDWFVTDFSAVPKEILLNYRSAPRLLQLQQTIVHHITGREPDIKPSEQWSPNDGICERWDFPTPDDEAEHIAEVIHEWILHENIQPRDICILVRQKAAGHVNRLLPVFRAQSSAIASVRNEDQYQDLLSEEITQAILALMRLALNKPDPSATDRLISLLARLRSIALVEGHRAVSELSNQLEQYCARLSQDLRTIQSKEQLNQGFFQILSFIGESNLRGHIPKYA